MEIEIKDNSEEVLSAVEKAMINALHRIGARAEGFAKKLAPVATGRLRNSITYAVAKDETAVYVGTNVEYAIYQELGTSRGIKPKKFLTKAATEHTGTYSNIIADEFAKIK